MAVKSRAVKIALASSTVLSGLSMLAFAGSSSVAQAKDQKVVLTFWKEPNVAGNTETAFYKNIIKGFEKLHPNIQVNYLQVPWANAQEKMTAAFTSNNPPDITYQVDMWLNSFAAQKALYPISNIPGNNTLYKNDYSFTVKGASYQGIKYGVPYIADFWPLVMNKDVWIRAGKPKLPETYSQLADFVKKLTFDIHGKHPGQPGFDKKHIATYGLMQVDDWGTSVNYIYNYLWSFGADYVNKQGTDIGFNNPQGKAALDWLKNLENVGAATPPNLYAGTTATNDWSAALAKGKIAVEWLQAIYPNMVQANHHLKLMVLPVPKGPGGRYVLGTGGYLAISAKSQHPKEALEFIRFLTNSSNENAWLRLSGFFPVRPTPSRIYNGIGANQGLIQQALPQEKYIRTMHTGLKYSPHQLIIGEMNDYIDGRKDFQSMASNASQQVQLMAANAGQ